MRLVRMHIVRPDVVLPAGSAHRWPFLDGIRKTREQLVAADARACEFTCFAHRLCVAIRRSTIALPPVVATAADDARPLGGEVSRIDDRAAPSTIRHVL